MTPLAKMRLDEILLREKLATEEQIKEALLRQKMQGGKFGSHLLYHRYIDEAGLVKALSMQFGCEGVILSGLDIPPQVIKLVPSKLALTRMVLPFSFDPQTQTLKVACENPSDTGVLSEIGFMLPGKRVKLYVAAELALETAINKFYLGRDTKLNDKLLVEIPDLGGAGETTKPQEGAPKERQAVKKAILIVTDEEYSASLLESLLGRDGCEVTVCDSCARAIEKCAKEPFQAILVKESLDEHFGELMDRLRKNPAGISVRVFGTASELLLNEEQFSDEIARKNLDLLALLLSDGENSPDNHLALVGHYADKLCRRIGLSQRDRLCVVSAGYLHDVSKLLNPRTEPGDYRATIDSSRQVLESFGYPDTVTSILGFMYRDLEKENQSGLSLEVIGGNILTVVDLFCQNVLFDRRFTLEKFDAVKKRLRDFSGKLFLADVVEAFIGMIQDEIINLQSAGPIGQVIIFGDDAMATYPLVLRLKNEGFRVLCEGSPNSLATLCQRSLPDLLIIRSKAAPEEAISIVKNLVTLGLEFSKLPTILLAESQEVAKLAPLLDLGIEDVVPNDINHELLIGKIRKLRSQREQLLKSLEQPVGARGRLSDMNLIDLTQALAPGRRTVKITVAPSEGRGDNFSMFLSKGNIVFAELGDKKGPEAVYQAMTWTDGVWSVEPCEFDSLPAPNNNASNDAILMEGAYRLDEKMKAGKL